MTKCDDERRDRNGSGVFCIFALGRRDAAGCSLAQMLLLYISEKAVTVMAEFRKSVLRTEFLTPGPDGGVRPGHFRKYAVLR